MDAVKKSSFTLLEMSITMLLGGILIMALVSQFVAMARFKTALENKADPSREAYIILDHMTRVLRFASATGTISFASNSNEDILTADIEGGHAALVPLTTTPPAPPNLTTCSYQRSNLTADKNYFYFQVGEGDKQEISKYVTYFFAEATGTAPNREITLKLIFSKGDTVTPVQTKIRVLVE